MLSDLVVLLFSFVCLLIHAPLLMCAPLTSGWPGVPGGPGEGHCAVAVIIL